MLENVVCLNGGDEGSVEDVRVEKATESVCGV